MAHDVSLPLAGNVPLARSPERARRAALAGTAFALAAAACAAFANVAGKHAFERAGATPLALIGAAYALAGLALLPVAWRFRLADRRDLLPLVGALAAGVVIAPAALFAGFARTTAVTASLLVNLETVFTALLAWAVLRERVDGREGLALGAIALGGLVVAVGPDVARGEAPELASLAGPALVALAALGWSVDSTISTRLLSRYPPTALLGIKALVGGIALPLLALAIEGNAAPPRAAWPHALIVAALGVVGSMAFFFGALTRVGATRTVVLFSTAGLWGAAAARVALGEALTWLHLAGAGLMMLGVVAFAREAGRAEARSLAREGAGGPAREGRT